VRWRCDGSGVVSSPDTASATSCCSGCSRSMTATYWRRSDASPHSSARTAVCSRRRPDPVDLEAHTASGTVAGQAAVATTRRILDVRLSPARPPVPRPGVTDALRDADLVLLGPGRSTRASFPCCSSTESPKRSRARPATRRPRRQPARAAGGDGGHGPRRPRRRAASARPRAPHRRRARARAGPRRRGNGDGAGRSAGDRRGAHLADGAQGRPRPTSATEDGHDPAASQRRSHGLLAPTARALR
jgi:hypothetical protein